MSNRAKKRKLDRRRTAAMVAAGCRKRGMGLAESMRLGWQAVRKALASGDWE